MKFHISFVGLIRNFTSWGERKQSIVMTFCNMGTVYRHIKYVSNWKFTFSMLLALIENSHFHFLLILDRIVNRRQIRCSSTFSLHNYYLTVFSNLIWPPPRFFQRSLEPLFFEVICFLNKFVSIFDEKHPGEKFSLRPSIYVVIKHLRKDPQKRKNCPGGFSLQGPRKISSKFTVKTNNLPRCFKYENSANNPL